MQEIDRQNKAKLQQIKWNAYLSAISLEGMADATLSANTLGISELFGTNLDQFNTDEEKAAYLRGRIGADVATGIQVIDQMLVGGGAAAVTGVETLGVGALAGLGVAGHGLGKTLVATHDITWALNILSTLHIEAAHVDANTSTNDAANAAHGGTPEASASNTSNKTDNRIQNKIDGDRRESIERSILEQEYPDADVQGQRYLRDANGKILKDPVTGKGRVVDFAVVKENKVIKMVETTSMKANKTQQFLKEQRIRNAGGTYIRDAKTKKLIDISNVETTTSRRE